MIDSALADVRNISSGRQGVCWLVSVSPGNISSTSAQTSPSPVDYVVAIIDARTGFALYTVRGYDARFYPLAG